MCARESVRVFGVCARRTCARLLVDIAAGTQESLHNLKQGQCTTMLLKSERPRPFGFHLRTQPKMLYICKHDTRHHHPSCSCHCRCRYPVHETARAPVVIRPIPVEPRLKQFLHLVVLAAAKARASHVGATVGKVPGHAKHTCAPWI